MKKSKIGWKTVLQIRSIILPAAAGCCQGRREVASILSWGCTMLVRLKCRFHSSSNQPLTFSCQSFETNIPIYLGSQCSCGRYVCISLYIRSSRTSFVSPHLSNHDRAFDTACLDDLWLGRTSSHDHSTGVIYGSTEQWKQGNGPIPQHNLGVSPAMGFNLLDNGQIVHKK